MNVPVDEQPLSIVRRALSTSATVFITVIFGLIGTGGTGANFTTSVTLDAGVITVAAQDNIVRKPMIADPRVSSQPSVQSVSGGGSISDTVAVAGPVALSTNPRDAENQASAPSSQRTIESRVEPSILPKDVISLDDVTTSDSTASADGGNTNASAPTQLAAAAAPETNAASVPPKVEGTANPLAPAPDAAQ